MSVHLRLLANAPGSLRPSEPVFAAELAEVDGDVAAEDPMTADGAGAGLPLTLFEVHAFSKASAMHAAVAVVAIARRWRR